MEEKTDEIKDYTIRLEKDDCEFLNVALLWDPDESASFIVGKPLK